MARPQLDLKHQLANSSDSSLFFLFLTLTDYHPESEEVVPSQRVPFVSRPQTSNSLKGTDGCDPRSLNVLSPWGSELGGLGPGG